MLKKTLFLPAALTLFINCPQNGPSGNPGVQHTVTRNPTDPSIQNAEEKSPTETVKAFMKWYKENRDQLYTFNTVRGGMFTETDPPVTYHIDFDEVEKEIKFLEESDLFSPKFLSVYKQRYVDGNDHFKQNPTYDGPPEDFDYDYFFLTQDDYASDLVNIDAIKFSLKPINDKLCYIQFHLKNCGMTYKYVLIKGDQWQIDSINTIS
ncbi:MAG: hypothetical protein MUW56_20250 [Chryseobacterium sp.]|uniref:hypothetical protein n=1 Tax=Chryseobacterium sp. TaxID=1871047 RepID=UPI0025C06627|nr:hypothetical protein [Chryseobacterium sp.]MCJ7935890.1 hypothetical protein [Chryseobacterium sp.]